MKAVDIKAQLAAVAALSDTGSTIYGILNNATKAAAIDSTSEHTYYGLPESCIDDLITCSYILQGVYNKLYKITG